MCFVRLAERVERGTVMPCSSSTLVPVPPAHPRVFIDRLLTSQNLLPPQPSPPTRHCRHTTILKKRIFANQAALTPTATSFFFKFHFLTYFHLWWSSGRSKVLFIPGSLFYSPKVSQLNARIQNSYYNMFINYNMLGIHKWITKI